MEPENEKQSEPARLAKLQSELVNSVIGLTVIFVGLVYAILSVPILIYRFVVCSFLTPFFPSSIGNPVHIQSVAMATELMEARAQRPPRNAIVVTFPVEGTVPKELITESVESQWLNLKDPKGNLRYPELLQYSSNWLGFLFWRKDESFSLKNHLFFHELHEDESMEHSERYEKSLVEHLLNRPFPPKRSPWEFHVVFNFKSKELLAKTKEDRVTLLIFRCHHSLSDGMSNLILGRRLFKDPIDIPREMEEMKAKLISPPKRSTGVAVLSKLKVLLQFPRDLGFALKPAFINEHSPFCVEDKDKSWKQVCAKAPLIPVEQIKAIRRKFGVSFTSVLIVAIEVAQNRFLDRKGLVVGESEKRINFGVLLALPDHPDQLMNHASATFIESCLRSDKKTIERLEEVDKHFTEKKSCSLPLFIPWAMRITSFSLAHIVRSFSSVCWASGGMTNFCGPSKALYMGDHKVIDVTFAAGGAPGNVGIAYQVLGYCDQIRINAVAESALMSRGELEDLVHHIRTEINRLYKIAKNSSSEINAN